jgi:mono/diheme cytochrome c family protein
VDDFRLARNLVVGNPLLARPPTSPTSYPPLWGTDRVKWLGWDGNADSTMQRNIGTALAIGAVFDAGSTTSTIPLDDVYRLEVIGSKVKPPKWPFGPINAQQAAAGAAIYRKLCAQCHVDPASSSPAATVPAWLPDKLYDPAPAGDGQGAAKGPADPDQVVGTDPNRALNFYEDWDAPPPPNAVDSLRLLQKVLYAKGGISPWDARRLRGDRTETWQRTGKYAARPLTATWAAAPYLHNDSVPTLRDLLLPVARRPVRFTRGGRRFDPSSVGYAEPGPGEPGFLFDTTKPGNRNIGHEYGTNLNDMERASLLEYLKTL